MELKQLFRHAVTSMLPDQPSIRRVLRGPLAGSKLCCRHDLRPHYLLGHYELEVLEALSANLKPGQVAYDIGANIGYLSLCMAKLVDSASTGHVFAFEPAPNAFRMLSTNCQLNAHLPIETFPIAVSDISSIEPFSFFDFDVVSRLGDHSAVYSDAHRTHVRVEPLDLFVEQFHIAPPDFVKIDVEGNELNVLRGMHSLLERQHPRLLIETHAVGLEGDGSEDTADEVMKMVQPLGYHCEFIQDQYPRQLLCT